MYILLDAFAHHALKEQVISAKRCMKMTVECGQNEQVKNRCSERVQVQ